MKKILYILITVGLFSSCEYDPSGNNFIELTAPDDFIAIDISLNDIDPSDTIYVFQDTRISIKINANKALQQTVILLDGERFNYLWGNPYNFIIRPDELSEGVHKLTVNAFFTSGSGSLADLMVGEYVGEMSWNIRIMREKHFSVDYRLNEEGFLEIYWENLIPKDAVKNYVVRFDYNSKEEIIDDPMQKSFVDYGYVCGYASYEVKTNLKSGQSYSQSINLDKPIPKIYFEELGLSEFRIYWNKPFANARFNLKEVDAFLVSESNDTTVTLPLLFGEERQFHLEVRPQKSEYDRNNNYFGAYGIFIFSKVSSLDLPNSSFYAYNTAENIIYVTRYDYLVALDATTLQEKNNIEIKGKIWGLSHSGRIAAAPHSSAIAVMTGEDTWIFENSRFANSIVIPNVPGMPGNTDSRLSALTSDDRFFVVQQRTSGKCQIFDAKTGTEIFDFSFKHAVINSAPNFVTVSDDGRYFFAASANGMELFAINGTTVNLLCSDTRRYTSALFVPNQPDKLLIGVDSNIELRQMPNFNLIQKIDVSPTDAMLCNVDPKTGNLLYYQDGFLKIAPVNNLANLIFEIGSRRTCSLLNNKLLTGRGSIVFDVTPYINQ